MRMSRGATVKVRLTDLNWCIDQTIVWYLSFNIDVSCVDMVGRTDDTEKWLKIAPIIFLNRKVRLGF